MKQKNGAFGAGQFSLGKLLVADPAPLSLKTWGGEGGGGGLGGCRIQGPGVAAPPVGIARTNASKERTGETTLSDQRFRTKDTCKAIEAPLLLGTPQATARPWQERKRTIATVDPMVDDNPGRPPRGNGNRTGDYHLIARVHDRQCQ